MKLSSALALTAALAAGPLRAAGQEQWFRLINKASQAVEVWVVQFKPQGGTSKYRWRSFNVKLGLGEEKTEHTEDGFGIYRIGVPPWMMPPLYKCDWETYAKPYLMGSYPHQLVYPKSYDKGTPWCFYVSDTQTPGRFWVTTTDWFRP